MFELIKSMFSGKSSDVAPLNRVEPSSKEIVVQGHPELVKIPAYRKKLLYLSNKEPQGHGFRFSINISADGDVSMSNEVPDDPSTIYSTLPVRNAKPNEPVRALSYYPTYSGMDPEQRGHYLKWLCDISQEVDIGYVFIFYYGLERQLISGDFNTAVDEILLLRAHHKNGSFQSYSASALIHACLMRKRPEVLKKLYDSADFDYFGNSNLLILYHSGLDLLPDMLLLLANRLTGVNRRYLKAKPDVYLKILTETLIEDYGKPAYGFVTNYKLSDIKGIPYPIFANITLPSELRTPELPNFLQHPPFQQELGSYFQKIHDRVKQLPRQKKA